MIDLQEKTLMSFLYKVKEQAVMNKGPQLFSWTKEIEPVDVLEVFQAAHQTEENRLFWTNHHHDFSIVGIGVAKKIIATENSEARFTILQQQWRETLDEAMIHNPYEQMGTGLAAIGGMSFDPKRPTTSLWEKFPSGRMSIPKYVLIKTTDKYYLTVNRFLDTEEPISEVITEIEDVESTLFYSHFIDKPKNQKIIDKKVIAPDVWKASVEKAVQEIKQHQAKKIVMAREIRLTLNRTANIGDLLKRLMATQPNSYVFAFEEGEDCFIGATPERLVLIESDQLLSTCLAGTAPRGKTVSEDKKLAYELLHDEKNREEHAYVVQMIKGSIEPYCVAIDIPEEPVIYPLRNLQHLYTPVKANLKTGHSVFDIVKKLHPTPALGGLPRDKALQFIREEEYLDRGWYGAPIGWLDSNHNSEFAVAIRSGLVQKDEVSLFAGCGVMRDSNPEMEFEETNVKFLPMLHVLEDDDESY